MFRGQLPRTQSIGKGSQNTRQLFQVDKLSKVHLQLDWLTALESPVRDLERLGLNESPRWGHRIIYRETTYKR